MNRTSVYYCSKPRSHTGSRSIQGSLSLLPALQAHRHRLTHVISAKVSPLLAHCRPTSPESALYNTTTLMSACGTGPRLVNIRSPGAGEPPGSVHSVNSTRPKSWGRTPSPANALRYLSQALHAPESALDSKRGPTWRIRTLEVCFIVRGHSSDSKSALISHDLTQLVAHSTPTPIQGWRKDRSFRLHSNLETRRLHGLLLESEYIVCYSKLPTGSDQSPL